MPGRHARPPGLGAHAAPGSEGIATEIAALRGAARDLLAPLGQPYAGPEELADERDDQHLTVWACSRCCECEDCSWVRAAVAVLREIAREDR
jgi:hypothetical protein